MIPKEIREALNDYFRGHSLEGEIISTQSIGGGSINEALKISTATASYFLKYNSAAAHPQMFASEFKGLQLMVAGHSIRIPEPKYFYEGQKYSCILMEYVEQGSRHADFWLRFAQQLADMHRQTEEVFGLNFDNYMGSLPQSNKQYSDFVSFFINERLEPQIKLARDSGYLNKQHLIKANVLYRELDSIFPQERPALVHGDLWSGNFMNDEKGNPVIMDPAVYYGHREVDMAMTTMFGGFSSEFYRYYQEAFPMEAGWEDRMAFYKLYPVLIHVNLFGYSYLSSFESVVDRF